MADDEAKAKAEKLAAAKKRVEQIKKQKAKKAVGKAGEAAPKTVKEEESTETPAEESPTSDVPLNTSEEKDDITGGEKEEQSEEPADIKTRARQQSISVQSKLRSESFKHGGGSLSPSMLSPEGDTAPDIYRRQATRIDELEKENKRLAKEATDAERRWKKAEEELEVIRENEGDDAAPKPEAQGSPSSADEVQKLKSQIATLERQNTQLQAAASRPRHGASPSISLPPGDLTSQLASKSSTIESMELEISNLRAQLAKSASGTSLEKEQIAALEEKLARTQKSLTTAENSLSDLKKNLDRTTEKAVKEGSERTSAETKLRALGQEAQEAKDHAEALQKKVDALEKKVAALTTLHKEHDVRSQALKRENEKSAKDLSDLRNKFGSLENDNSRLRDELERSRKAHAQGVDDEGVDELESEERHKLERKIRDLESEVFDLKRGLWKDSRKELDGESSAGAQFTDIDLGGASPGAKRRSAQGKGLGDLFQSGLNALTGAHEDLLEDDDGEFDEEAFRMAHEEEARKRMERVREVKRGLPAWKSWRLDLVEARRGAEFGGEIFEV